MVLQNLTITITIWPKAEADKKKNRITYENLNALYKARELVLIASKSGTFSIDPAQRKGYSSNLACATKISDY